MIAKRLIALLCAASLAAAPAWADYTVKDSTGATVTIQAGTNGGKVAPSSTIVNSAGTAILHDGTDTVYAGSGSTTIAGYLKGIYTALTGAIPAGTAIIGKVGIDQTTQGTTNGVAPKFGAAQLSSAAFTASSSGDNTVVTRVTGTIKIYGLEFACASAQVSFTFKNGAGTTVGGTYYNVAAYSRVPTSEPMFTTTGTNNFIVNMAGAVNCGGTVYYIDS